MRLSSIQGFSFLVLAFLLVLAGSPGTPVFSQGRYPLHLLLRCTRDEAILQAFGKMAGTSGEASLDWIVKKPVRVFFKDLATFNKKLKNYDALSWLGYEGQQIIYINYKHQSAPPEALAALISHEALHSAGQNSVAEEIAGWTQEATVWQEMKKRYPGLAAIPDKQVPLVARLNRIESEYLRGTLPEFVRNNPGYRGLPETSPGFGNVSALEPLRERAIERTGPTTQIPRNPASALPGKRDSAFSGPGSAVFSNLPETRE